MSVFRFKQFDVNQTGCAMKVNTDGVLLAALTDADKPENILDIGAGTGVISLILAQRFQSANIKAVEIDEAAAAVAAANFAASPFQARLQAFPSSFEEYLSKQQLDKLDLIISNPPFFIDSLKSDDPLKRIARHTDLLFFQNLLRESAVNLSKMGELVMILPGILSVVVQKIALQYGMFLRKSVSIKSFASSKPHREILYFGLLPVNPEKAADRCFVIYSGQKEYSGEYRALLKDFLIIF